jgi:enamine deaminase RidA (YjgF/YER057c/UK114 family)
LIWTCACGPRTIAAEDGARGIVHIAGLICRQNPQVRRGQGFQRKDEETIMSAEARLKQLGITLPNVPAPVANYLPYRQAGNLLFLAGQGPREANGNLMTGKVGGDVSVEEGYKRARIIGLQLLSATRMALGSLDRVDTVLKMLCMVNAVPDFKDHPKVANGMSDLFVEVFGDAGKHARSAVGMGSLPGQISVEIEGVLSVKP